MRAAAVLGAMVLIAASAMAQPQPGDPAYGEYVSVDELPEALKKVPPLYSEAMRAARLEGTVIVQALVGRDGLVRDTHVAKSVPGLDSAAVAAIRQWTFKPARSNGKPVPVWVAVPLRFSLGNAVMAPSAPASPPAASAPQAPPTERARPDRPRQPGIKAMPPPPVPETLHVARDERPLDVAPFNTRLAAAGDSAWAKAPATIAIEFAGGADCHCAHFGVEATSQPEAFDVAQVTVVRDGLLDDSIAGDRHRLAMRRDEAGRWRIESALLSWRCAGGRGHDGYGIAPCK